MHKMYHLYLSKNFRYHGVQMQIAITHLCTRKGIHNFYVQFAKNSTVLIAE